MNLKNEFEKVFETKNTKKFFSPGRVNLIGEHIDYNGGHVFPCNLDIGTYALISKSTDNNFNFYSLNFSDKGIISVPTDDLEYKEKNDYVNYFTGVCYFLAKDYGVKFDFGLNILVFGNIPSGAGLSSSASIEVLMGTIIKNMYKTDISQVDLVKLCQKSENQYNGVNCGIMDQFVIGMCKKNNAILLDTNTLDYEDVPLALDKYKIVICNSKVRRGLADSKYNERRGECDSALELFNKFTNSNEKFLCPINLNTLNGVKDKFLLEKNGDVLFRRVHHAITEDVRTLLAKEKLTNNDFIGFGNLLFLSHASLRDDYEVSCKELDTLVELARENGAIGSRMTGAGFGGCTVSIVHEDLIDDFIKNVTKDYKEKTDLDCEIYIGNSGDFAKELGGN